ncbi:MAG: hypothetical protein ACRENE_20370 [Polyangiaceae bacterium]
MKRVALGAVAVLGVFTLGAAPGCAGKGADSPGSCPDGTVLKGSDCVPSDSAGDTSGGGGDDSDAPKKKTHAKSGGDEDKVGGDQGESAASGGTSSGGGKSYDKDEIDAKMKRSAKQIKANCGAATDDEGKATGPWGSVHVSIVLGRNGHVKDVAVPDPYNGKPVGTCISRQLMKIIFAPYAGSSDASIEEDFELVKPK